jgi:hypothetical protein
MSAGLYILNISQNGCTSLPDSVIVAVTCLDSVWAGDANYDKLVDNLDALEIALAMHSTGPARAASSIAWQAAFCRDWATTLPGYPGINRKHADCDGDSSVTYNDTLAVTANYGFTHPKGIRITAKKTAGDPDLYFDISGVNPVAGSFISIPIKLGTPTMPVPHVAGLAARLTIEGEVPSDTPSLSYSGSWLGNSSTTLTFRKPVSNSRIDWAYARTDQRNTSGYGTLAWLSFRIPEGSEGQQMRFYFDEVSLVDSNGGRISVNALADTLTILAPTGILPAISGAATLSVSPNPSAGACIVRLRLPAAGPYLLELRDISGRLVLRSSGNGRAGLQHVSLPAESLRAGVYLISLQSPGVSARPVRWTKST